MVCWNPFLFKVEFRVRVRVRVRVRTMGTFSY